MFRILQLPVIIIWLSGNKSTALPTILNNLCIINNVILHKRSLIILYIILYL